MVDTAGWNDTSAQWKHLAQTVKMFRPCARAPETQQQARVRKTEERSAVYPSGFGRE